MADEDLNPKMRYNPLWYQGWDFAHGNGGPLEITEDIDMKGFGIKNMKDPANPQDAVTKKYVDDRIAGGGGGGPTTANLVTLTPTGNIQATNVQDAFAEMAQEAAIKDEENTFTKPQTIGGAEISEVPSAVPYSLRPRASATGKVTNISSANPINFETTEITLNGNPIPAKDIGYTAKPGGQVQGVTVQDALTNVDGLITNTQGNFVAKSGLTADFSAGSYKITDLAPGTDPKDVVNFQQLQAKADRTDLTTLEGKVTTNTTAIEEIVNGTTKIQASNVTFTPGAGGIFAGQDTVQKALGTAETTIKTNQDEITALKAADATFVTKVGGTLGGDLNASDFKITNVAPPQADKDSTNKKYVDDAVRNIQGAIAGQLQWAGTYDCTNSQIQTLSDAGKALQDAQGNPVFALNSNVPQPSATTKNFYFIAVNKAPATPQPPAPQKALSAGDWIIGETTAWNAIEMAKAVTASNVSFNQAGSITSNNVQQAVEELDTDLTALSTKVDNVINGTGPNQLGADKVSYTAVQGGAITGATVQDAISNADNHFKTVGATIQKQTTDIAAINTTLGKVAKLDVANAFTALNTFAIAPQTTATPTQDQELATVKLIKDTVRALKATYVSFDPAVGNKPGLQGVANVQAAIDKVSDASNIAFASTSGLTQTTVSSVIEHLNSEIGRISGTTVKSQDVLMTTQLTNLTGANVQEVLAKADSEVGRISDHLVNNSSLVGTYDIAQNRVIEAFGLGTVGNPPQLTVNQEVPQASDANKTFVLVVKNGGTIAVAGRLPAGTYNSGDFIRSDGASWHRIDASEVKTATDIAITPINNVTGGNVQEALQSLATKQSAPINASQVSANTQGPITGANVQEAITSVGITLQGHQTQITQVENEVQPLKTAQGIRYDNTLSQITGNPANVQKAIEAINTKITSSITGLDAANVAFTSTAGITGNTVAKALDELKTNESSFVTKVGGQLGGNLDAGGNTVTNIKAPTSDLEAANKKYVDDQQNNLTAGLENIYVKKTGGILTGPLNAGGQKITALATPTDPQDVANKKYVDDQKAGLDAIYVKKDGGSLASDLDAVQNKIINLMQGTDAGDAVNKEQLDQAIQGIQGQLVGKLTYCGTYNASTNRVASVSTAGTTHGLTVGSPLPADSSQIANCFVIVTVAGTGVAPAPAENLGVGDIVLAQGGNGWLNIPIGSTRTASNVSITAIQQLANASNVQQALEQLASRRLAASDISFTATGGLTSTDVQDAIQQIHTKSVKIEGDQTIEGDKTFNGQTSFAGNQNGNIILGSASNGIGYIKWETATNKERAWLGFVSKKTNESNRMFFKITSSTSSDPGFFQFNRVIEYQAALNLDSENEKALVHKKYIADKCVLLEGDQTIVGSKTFTSPVAIQYQAVNKPHLVFKAAVVERSTAFIEWKMLTAVDTEATRARLGFTTTNDTAHGNTMYFEIVGEYAGKGPRQFMFSQIAGYETTGLVPTDGKHFTSKQYVDDAIARAVGGGGGGASGLAPVSATNVDVTSSFVGLTGKGTASFSYRLLKATDDGSILSALFGMKLTLTAPWTPTVSNTPSEFAAGAHIPGQQYYLGLPIPIDNSLGGNYKTVAHINLYRVVPTGGIPLIQQDAPINLGRIVGLNDNTGSGWTKLYAVISSSTEIQPPVGQGAFYVMRYEGLQAMPMI